MVNNGQQCWKHGEQISFSQVNIQQKKKTCPIFNNIVK